MSKLKSRLPYALIINLFFAITLLVYGPYEIFILNINDFDFTFANFWWIPVITACFYTAIASAICSIFPDKLYHVALTAIFSFVLCCYIQSMFLNNQMKVLVGNEVSWSIQTKAINLLIWLFIFVLVFFIQIKFSAFSKKIFRFIACSLIIMQLVSLIFLFVTTDVLKDEKNGYLSTEGMFELSSENNVIVFILDTFDERVMHEILSEDPDFLSPLDGFTYFPNTTSVHSRTYPSVTYMLTGNQCYFDLKPGKYVNDSFQNSDFLPTLHSETIDIGLYTFADYIGNSAKTKLCNHVPAGLSIKFYEMEKYLVKMILYRDMPYLAKPRFAYEVTSINNNVTSNTRRQKGITEIQSGDSPSPYRNFDDEWFDAMIEDSEWQLTESTGSFRFYHLGSCHLDLNNSTEFGKRSLEIVYHYIDRLKALEIYDSTTIIITADHGYSGGGGLDLPQETAAPIMIVKPSGTSGQPLAVSNAPVSHTDFIPTVLDGFSLDYSAYGNTVFDIEETAVRERYYYYSALNSNEEGEIELREYKVTGDARQPSSYQYTGNRWDILYSYNIVAPK